MNARNHNNWQIMFLMYDDRMIITPVKTRLFMQGENILDFIERNIKNLNEGDVLAITSKIVALSQNRVVDLSDKEKAIMMDSQRAIRNKWGHLTVRNNEWMMNAGVDESNAFGKVILLPSQEFYQASFFLRHLKKTYALKKLGIILTDTRSMPLRHGVEGIALAYAGFEPLKSYIGKKDLSKRIHKLTKVNVADSLAAVAVYAMGEGDESMPLCLLRDCPVKFTSKKFTFREVVMDAKKDLYRDAYIA